MARIFLLFSICILILLPGRILANGGPQNYVDGYIVAMSNSPFVPEKGEQVSFIFSLVSSETYEAVKKPIAIKLQIHDKFHNPVSDVIPVSTASGFLEFAYIFPKDGMYEIDVDFTIEGEKERSTHFLLGIKSVEKVSFPLVILVISSGLALLTGMMFGYGVARWKHT